MTNPPGRSTSCRASSTWTVSIIYDGTPSSRGRATGTSTGIRLLNTFEIYEDDESGRDIVWAEKSLLVIEEYIFSRYYMYQNVYLHKTTRGFEKMVEAMWATGEEVLRRRRATSPSFLPSSSSGMRRRWRGTILRAKADRSAVPRHRGVHRPHADPGRGRNTQTRR